MNIENLSDWELLKYIEKGLVETVPAKRADGLYYLGVDDGYEEGVQEERERWS